MAKHFMSKQFMIFSRFFATIPWTCTHKGERQLQVGNCCVGRISVDSKSHSVWPLRILNENDIEQVTPVFLQDRPITMRETGKELGVCVESVYEILTYKLVMRTVSVIFVLKLLKMEQNYWRLDFTQTTLDNTKQLQQLSAYHEI